MIEDNNKVRIIELPKISDPRGNLSFLEGNKHIPFEIKRAYWIYDVAEGRMVGVVFGVAGPGSGWVPCWGCRANLWKHWSFFSQKSRLCGRPFCEERLSKLKWWSK